MDANRLRNACARRGTVAGLWFSAARVLPSAAQPGDADVPLPASRASRSLFMARVAGHHRARFLPAANTVHKLLSEAEMGELYKVIGFGRGIDQSALDFAFATGDRSQCL